MKSCSILISNFNSFESIQLVVESVRKYTTYPHKIVVFNDGCTNGFDDLYLRECRDKGWLELHESSLSEVPLGEGLTHGGVLNHLINDICDTDLAAILDCDTQVKAAGWLEDMIECVEADPQILAVADMGEPRLSSYGYYVPGFYRLWFGLLNMEAYRDGMQVDWMHERTTRDHEPYKNMFHCLDGVSRPARFNDNLVDVDPGSKLWVKIHYDNPKGYKTVPLPDSVKNKFWHYGHISMISIPHPTFSESAKETRTLRMATIHEELNKLRGQV
jgi:hypothetical protein